MGKNKLLKIVNLAVFVSFAAESVTGIMMMIRKGPKIIFAIHEYNGVLLIILIIMHLYLNWDWIKTGFLKNK